MAESRLEVTIRNSRPIELKDLSQSLNGLSNEFRRYIDQVEPGLVAADVRLYIEEIRKGSIIADIVAISPHAMQILPFVNVVATFAKHLRTAYDWLSGNSDEKPFLDKASYQNLSNIVEPIAKDRAAQINLGNVDGNVYIQIDSQRANAIQNRARQEIEALGESTSGLHEKVLFYWWQARADAKSKVGDRGIIESIARSPIKVICLNDEIKSEMVFADDNPFMVAYIVDVLVETIRGQPRLYKILKVHDKFDREEPEDVV